MSSSVQPRPERTEHTRWVALYVVLATFEVLTIAATLWLSHRFVDSHASAVTQSAQLSDLAQRYADLDEVASAVHRPAIDVFLLRDTGHAAGKLTEARAQFAKGLRERRDELRAREKLLKDPSRLAALSERSRTLDSVEALFATLAAEVEEVLALFKAGDLERAAQRMAKAADTGHQLHVALADLRAETSHAQQLMLIEQADSARSLQAAELIVSVVLLCCVLALLVYGRRLSSAMARSARDLRNSEENFRALIERSPDGVVVHHDRRVVYVNPSVVSALGYSSASELIGQDMGELFHPDDRERAVARTRRAEERGSAVAEESRLLKHDGASLDAEVISLRVNFEGGGPATVELVRDVTERKKGERALRRQALTFEALHDAVILTDVFGQVIDWSPSAERMFGRSRAEALGKPPPLSLEGTGADLRDILRAVGQDGRWKGEFEFTRSDGRPGVCESVVVPMKDSDGTLLGTLSCSRDITERKRAEEAMRRSEQAAEAANRAKTDFLANMSHELRTPLNAVLGFARVLQNSSYGPLTDRQRAFLGNIARSSEHMLSLINDLLDLRKVEANKTDLTLVDLDARAALTEALGLVQPVMEERHHSVEVRIDKSVGTLHADRRALMQILVNLLSNAAKYTPEGGRIALRCYLEGPMVAIEVADNGIGISPEDQRKLFEYFQQVGKKHEHSMKGSGVGLALTKALVEKLGGRVRVASAPGRGSIFGFTVPITAPAADTAALQVAS